MFGRERQSRNHSAAPAAPAGVDEQMGQRAGKLNNARGEGDGDGGWFVAPRRRERPRKVEFREERRRRRRGKKERGPAEAGRGIRLKVPFSLDAGFKAGSIRLDSRISMAVAGCRVRSTRPRSCLSFTAKVAKHSLGETTQIRDSFIFFIFGGHCPLSRVITVKGKRTNRSRISQFPPGYRIA